MEEEGSETSFFWYTIAMFYKYSTVPLWLSVVYAVFALKDLPFIYSDKKTSIFLYMCVALISLFLALIKLESDPSIFKSVFPSRLISTGDAFMMQYRLLITFVRWVFLLSVLYFLCLNNKVKECAPLPLAEMKACHRASLLVGHPWVVLSVAVGLVVLYILAVKKLEREIQQGNEVQQEKDTQHEKEE